MTPTYDRSGAVRPGYLGRVITAGDVVLVTGASSGIGLQVARRASSRGAHVVLMARGAMALQEAAMRCADAGALTTMVIPTDVGDPDQVASAVDDVVERHGRIDAAVNCAGVIVLGRFDEVPVDVHDRVVRTNLLGSANVARAVLPVFRRQGAGSLVLFGSQLGHVTAPYVGPYVVSKWGVRALARQLQSEYRDLRGVRIGYVAPGGVDTPIYQQAANYLGRDLRPPAPVCKPDRVARSVLDFLDGRSRRIDVGAYYGLSNRALRVSFHLLPARAYDAVALSMLALTGVEQDRPARPKPGNVLEPQHMRRSRPEAGARNPLVSAARNVASIVARRGNPARV